MSIADRFIVVMAQINSIEPDNDEPMRHAMRDCRRRAEEILATALIQAEAIAYMAARVQADAEKAVEKALAKPQAPT